MSDNDDMPKRMHMKCWRCGIYIWCEVLIILAH